MEELDTMEWFRFRDALAIVESGNNPAMLGSGGRAFGRWQMKPTWLLRHCPAPAFDETYDSFFERTLRSFYSHVRENIVGEPQVVARRAAMAFHVGRMLDVGDQDWDTGYDEKFTLMWRVKRGSV